MAEITNLNVLTNEEIKMVCPFRTEVVVGQRLNVEGVPEQYQITTFPECQYRACPFYNPTGKDINEKCFKSVMYNV